MKFYCTFVFRRGSLDVKFIILVANTDAARKDFSNAIYSLRDSPITVFGQQTLAQALRVGDSASKLPDFDLNYYTTVTV